MEPPELLEPPALDEPDVPAAVPPDDADELAAAFVVWDAAVGGVVDGGWAELDLPDGFPPPDGLPGGAMAMG
ncbi:MAG TPA: hypothetical protein DCQ30_00855 [Acidimicrobiaceae bacterium]|nr:hypothetical protein [Acidimicrobiaceae bacterium]